MVKISKKSKTGKFVVLSLQWGKVYFQESPSVLRILLLFEFIPIKLLKYLLYWLYDIYGAVFDVQYDYMIIYCKNRGPKGLYLWLNIHFTFGAY